MAKLPSAYPGTTTNEDLIQLLHDEVVSLCQKNYSTVSGLEIDGIICISVLDTKEQQVVKIHKTLKSVFADTKQRSKKQRTHEQPSYWLNGNLGRTGVPTEQRTNFQNDINALSNLLKDTNAAIRKEIEDKSKGASAATSQSKRKRRQPRQRVTSSAEPNADSKKIEKNDKTNLKNTPAESPDIGTYHNSPGINPFIHKDVVKVKEEKIDPEYDVAEQTYPKIVNVSSVSETEKEKTELSEGSGEKSKVASIIERIIEKEIPCEKNNDKTVDSEDKDTLNKETKGNGNDSCERENSEFEAIEVKVEKNIDESEYGGSKELDQGDFTGTGSDNVRIGASNSETENFECHQEWLYNEQSSLGEIGRTALLDKLHEKGSLALTGYPRERGRAERDPQGRSWIEMVKDNVNKYQAALERSCRDRNEVENGITDTSSTFQTAKLAKNASSLVALLQQPAAVLPKSREVTSNAILDFVRNSRGSSVPVQGTDQISDRSTSSSPIVKIEVDEDMTHEMFSQSDGEVNNDTKDRSLNSEVSQDNNGMAGKAPQGKLESRYPALFSHLQQGKLLGVDGQDQSDSLVNRLPFISFQELFSQVATGAQLPRLSESTTRQLLAQARINPYPSKEKQTGQRKVWNWKKRQVRPRDAEGRIISPISVNLKAQKEASKMKGRVFGFHNAVKKTFSKRGQKSETEQDKDWQPEAENIDVDSDVPGTSETAGSPGRRTRLSCGEKPRINFAELENSDVEIEEDEDIKEVEMFQACNTEQFTDNIPPLVYTERQEDTDNTPPLIYTESQGDNNSVFPGGSSEQLLAAFRGSSEQLNSVSTVASEHYKCSLCGLEFNQEYRWHYHLIKVHGINADKEKLFR